MSIEGKSDGSSADYYKLPPKATQLQDLISHRDMNAQIGEIFRACYRYGLASHSDKLRDAKKMMFYAAAEIDRLERLNQATDFSEYEQPKNCKTGFCGHGVKDWRDCLKCNPQTAVSSEFSKENYFCQNHGYYKAEAAICPFCTDEYKANHERKM